MERKQVTPTPITARFKDNGEYTTARNKTEMIQQFFRAQWSSPNLDAYLYDMQARLYSQGIDIKFKNIDEFFDELVRAGVVELK